jgi:hypothetical protein
MEIPTREQEARLYQDISKEQLRIKIQENIEVVTQLEEQLALAIAKQENILARIRNHTQAVMSLMKTEAELSFTR